MKSMFRHTFLLVAAILAVGAVSAVGASAATPELVNKTGKELVKTTFTAKGGRATIQVGLPVSCSASTITNGAVQGTKKASETIVFTGCRMSVENCTTHGKKSGEISLAVTSLLVEEKSGEAFIPAQLLTTNGNATFLCGESKLYEVRGSQLCRFSTTLSTTHELACSGNGKGQPSASQYEETIGGTLKTAKLEHNSNGGKFAEGDVEMEKAAEVLFEEEAQVK